MKKQSLPVTMGYKLSDETGRQSQDQSVYQRRALPSGAALEAV